MRILIASGIFEPEPGGPATYAPRLASGLAKAGWKVTVVSFSGKRTYPGDEKYPFRLVRVARGKGRLLNRLRLLLALLPHVWRSDLVYTLDWFAVGLPVSMLAKLFRAPYIVRVGGDYAWERYLESGRPPMTLADFYEQGMHVARERRAVYGFISSVLRGAAHVVFNSEKQRALYVKHYELPDERTSVIENPVPDDIPVLRKSADKQFAFWGRLIVMKNIAALVEAFAQAKLPPEYRLIVIGDGPQKGRLKELVASVGIADRIRFFPAMERTEAYERIKNSRAFVLPSWTDVSPNTVYECLSVGIPALVTKENYLSVGDQLPLCIDPYSVDDIAAKLEALADDSKYEEFSLKFTSIRFSHSWDDVLRQHVDLLGRLV